MLPLRTTTSWQRKTRSFLQLRYTLTVMARDKRIMDTGCTEGIRSSDSALSTRRIGDCAPTR
ncbi:hypothetical protein EX30DRAFT_21722 [Ascodesmis nigricans]|uniref:Uncharacterized protein n=1 Tax=Ascodesmis nigricans TaxID=341454 RepID=A0A4S2N7W0_9PEZI|nr:hypothetical protein EX30DRAFT_21722 [Ascodesmis nigricans]